MVVPERRFDGVSRREDHQSGHDRRHHHAHFAKHQHRKAERKDKSKQRSPARNARQYHRGQHQKDPERRYLAKPDEYEHGGAGQMHRDLARSNLKDGNIISGPVRNVVRHVATQRVYKGNCQTVDVQKHSKRLKHRIDAAAILQQQCDNDKGEPAIHDHDTVAQRLETIHAYIGQRAQQDPYHCRRKEKTRECSQRSDHAAGPQPDDQTGREGYLADEERRQSQICKTLSDHRISEQHDRQQDEILVAQADWL